MMISSRDVLVSVLLGALASSGNAFSVSSPRALAARTSRSTAPASTVILRDEQSSNLDKIEALVEEVSTFAVEPREFEEPSSPLAGIDALLLTVDEKELERDEEYMRQAIQMAQSGYVLSCRLMIHYL